MSVQISESLQYNPVKMYLTSIVIDPLPQLQLGQAEGYIQVSDHSVIFSGNKTPPGQDPENCKNLKLIMKMSFVTLVLYSKLTRHTTEEVKT